MDDGGEVLDCANATGLAFDGLDDSVNSLGGSVGDLGAQVGGDAGPMGSNGPCCLLHFRDLRAPPKKPHHHLRSCSAFLGLDSFIMERRASRWLNAFPV